MKISIPQNVNDKIKYWIGLSDNEVAGIGIIKIDGATIKVIDAFLVKQEVTKAKTTLDETALAELWMWFLQEQSEGRYKDCLLKWHWHCHGISNWSDIDLIMQSQMTQDDWFCFTVFKQGRGKDSGNIITSAIQQPATVVKLQSGEYRFASQRIENIKTQIELSYPKDEIDAWEESFVSLVNDAPPQYEWSKYNHKKYKQHKYQNDKIHSYVCDNPECRDPYCDDPQCSQWLAQNPIVDDELILLDSIVRHQTP